MKGNTRNARKKRIRRNKTRKHRNANKYGGYAYTTNDTATPRDKNGNKKLKITRSKQ